VNRLAKALPNGRYVIYGYDRAFDTWFAQLYDEDDDPNECPIAAIGYAPAEQMIARSDRPDVELGPYPVSSREALVHLVRTSWHVELDDIE
jgi:hypothetical protein